MRDIRSAPGVVVTVLAGMVALAACGAETAGAGRGMAETGAAGARPSPADNGIAAKTPREAVAAARQALATAKSVHVHGYLESGEPRPDKIDMWYGRDGLRGTMTSRENGTSGKWVTMEQIEVGGRSYMRGGLVREIVPPEVAARIGDRWVGMSEPELPASLPMRPDGPRAGVGDEPPGPPPIAPPPEESGGVLPTPPPVGGAAPHGAEGGGIKSLAEEFQPEDAASGTGRTTIGGLPAVGIKLGSHDPAIASDTIVYIATTGTPHILRQEIAGDGRHGIDFTEYDVPFDLSAPPDAVDLDKIMR